MKWIVQVRMHSRLLRPVKTGGHLIIVSDAHSIGWQFDLFFPSGWEYAR